MKTLRIALAGLTVLLLPTVSSAEVSAPKWDLSGATSANLGVDQFGDGGGESFALFLATRVSYFVTQTVEVGATARLSYVSSSAFAPTAFSTQLLVGPTLNFSEDVLNSFFVTAQAGLKIYYSSVSSNTYLPLALMGGIGRRVQLVQNVTWTPEFAVYGNPSTEANGRTLSSIISYELRLIQLSVLF